MWFIRSSRSKGVKYTLLFQSLTHNVCDQIGFPHTSHNNISLADSRHKCIILNKKAWAASITLAHPCEELWCTFYSYQGIPECFLSSPVCLQLEQQYQELHSEQHVTKVENVKLKRTNDELAHELEHTSQELLLAQEQLGLLQEQSMRLHEEKEMWVVAHLTYSDFGITPALIVWPLNDWIRALVRIESLIFFVFIYISTRQHDTYFIHNLHQKKNRLFFVIP